MPTKKEVLATLLDMVEQGKPILIVGLDGEGIPDIHNFYPKKYYESIEHCGFGFFEGRTEHGTFSFDGGGAMVHYSFDGDRWLSWSPLRVDNEQVLQDLGYDFERVANALRDILNKLP